MKKYFLGPQAAVGGLFYLVFLAWRGFDPFFLFAFPVFWVLVGFLQSFEGRIAVKRIKGKGKRTANFSWLKKVFWDRKGRRFFFPLFRSKKAGDEILNFLKEAVVVLDGKGSVAYANRMARRLFQLKAGQSLTALKDQMVQTAPSFSEKEIRGQFFAECLALAQKAQTFRTAQHKTLLFDGVLNRFLETTAIFRKQGLLLVFQDNSADLRRLQAAKEFAANVSHELKTPITIIRGFAEVLQDLSEISSEKSGEIVQTIINTAQRLENITAELLKLSELEHTEVLNLTGCDLKEVLEVQKKELLRRHPEVHFTSELTEEKTEVLVDRGLLELALGNLLENAVKYSQHFPEIRVILEKKPPAVLVKVQDRGVGLKATDCQRVFERFYTADKALSRRSGGTGLGLALVKSIVEKHRGKIEVESCLGRGSTFILHLPEKI
ncbi:MAG: ATP-binding protein [Parachlamydiales bacterium]